MSSLLATISHDETKIIEAELSEDSEEVATYVAGYVGSKLSECSSCEICISNLHSSDIDIHENSYFSLLSRGKLFVPSLPLADFVIFGFAILDIVEYIFTKCDIPARDAGIAILAKYCSASLDFSCQEHASLVHHQAIKKILNVFLNNKRKDSTNSVRKDEVAQYKALKLRTDG